MIERMENKLEEMHEDIHEIKLDLREHMARTKLAEEHIQLLKKETDPVRKAYIGIKWSITAIITASAVFTALIKFGVIGG